MKESSAMRRSYGQSMVEFALILPLLLLLIFAIIDLGWYVYNYASVNQAARNGSEAAAGLPPYEAVLEDPALKIDDPCYQTILALAQSQVIQPLAAGVSVRYPDDSFDPPRSVGNPIEVSVTYRIEPLTPLFQYIPLANGGVFTFTARSVRSIEALGFIPPSPEHPDGIACDDGN
jgi:hypothetical protein